MRIKLLDRNDIRRFGGTIVDVSDHIANELLSRNMAVRMDLQKIKVKKSFMAPPENKAVWVPPESKSMVALPESRKPKAEENLFPKSVIS